MNHLIRNFLKINIPTSKAKHLYFIVGPGMQKELSRGALADPIQRDIHVGGLALGVYDRQVWAEADTCDRRTPVGHAGLRHGVRPWDAAFYDTQKLTGSSRQGGLFNT